MLERMYGITPPEELIPPEIETPDLSIKIEELGEVYGRFMAEPLERGWAVTLGNPLRRALLSSLQGTAITWARIEGILHEYTTIEHMREEVGEFLLNVKGSGCVRLWTVPAACDWKWTAREKSGPAT